MDGWRTAEVVFRVTVVAAILATAAVVSIPKIRQAKADDNADSAPTPDSETAAPHTAPVGFRLGDRRALLDLVRCRSKTEPTEQAIHALHDKAEDGDVPAEYAVGVAYLRGWGVHCNPDLGLKYLNDAADADYAPALYLVGVAADAGYRQQRDVEGAVSSYRRAAEIGSVPAMVRLGALLAAGQDAVAQDAQSAADLLTKAADEGDADAAVDLGLMYQSGDYGLEASGADAYYWFSVAAQLGDDGAIDLERSAADGLSRDDLDAAAAHARRWRQEARNDDANTDFDVILDQVATTPSPPESGDNPPPAEAAPAAAGDNQGS